ncbi:MAG: hypothetical protein R3B09_03685 [Nannocystaceae bacterium]
MGASALVVASSLVIAAPPRALAGGSVGPGGASTGERAAPVDAPEAEASEAEAPEDPEARRREAYAAFQRARDLYQSGDFEEAAETFLLSYGTVPSLEALVAAALAFERAGRPIAAAATYREYLEFEDDDALRRQEALAAYQALRAKIGEIQLRVGNPAAIERLYLNDEPLTLADFPRLVMPGLVALKIVGASVEREIDAEVRPGGTTLINLPDLALIAKPPPRTDVRPPVVVETPPPSPPSPGPRIALWSGVGVTVAAVATAATLGGLTLRARDAYTAKLCPPPESGGCQDGALYPQAEEDRFFRLRTATNVMIGVSAGLAVITTALGVVVVRQRARAKARTKVKVRGSGVGLILRF